MRLAFDNSYARLPERFFARVKPSPVTRPGLVAVNARLARDLGLDPEGLASPEGLAMLAGNVIPDGAEPLAQAYAGHQFGGWVPQLGDGRAVLLGEVLAPDGTRHDIQLKGAGQTPFSRRGDGRAAIGPVLREYILSEAMAALGIPTTRALAAVTTGEDVMRETALPGAVLTRVASSHIRVGTFQYFAARDDTEALRLLTGMAIARHYPEAGDALELLRAAVAAQARLVAQWMAVGFIHGVMNTDNSHVGGITIDYGPCAFLDSYHPDKVFSSIDRQGRYAYGNQPQIAVWNMAQLATCLLPLIDADQNRAIEAATEAVHGFSDIFLAEWMARFRAKIGLVTAEDGDQELVETLLGRMAAQRADFTATFTGLAEGAARDTFVEPEAFDHWAASWRARLAREGRTEPEARVTMAGVNPVVIPRNHLVEQAIQAGIAGDFAPFHRLNAVLASPFSATCETRPFRAPPLEDERVRQTFCGT